MKHYPDKPLQNKIAVVSGAARGVGRGIAIMLADAGAKVYVADIKSQPGAGEKGTVEDAVKSIQQDGGQAVGVKVDFTKDSGVKALFERIEQEDGRLDILVANAFNGNALPFAFGPLWELDMRSWDVMFTSGLRNHIAAVHNATPLLLKSQGTIVLTGFKDSNYPEQGGNIFYDLAMHAITRLTADLAHDFKEANVPVVAISPGLVRTEAIVAAMGPHPEGSQSPEYCGKAVVSLASDQNLMERSGNIYSVGSLAKDYTFTDLDGTQPD